MNCAFDLDCLVGYKPKKRPGNKFFKGHTPHNKGKKWSEWMSEDGKRKVLQTLDNYRPMAQKIRQERHPIGGINKKHVIASKDGRELWFESATHAARALSLIRRNISHCANGERKTCGGWRFRWTETEQH